MQRSDAEKPGRFDVSVVIDLLLGSGSRAGEVDAMVAWLDGPIVDDGTACEIGIFSELVRTAPGRYRGIVGLATDWRAWRRRDRGMSDGGLNFFVGGAILEYGRFAWSIEEVEETLSGWG